MGGVCGHSRGVSSTGKQSARTLRPLLSMFMKRFISETDQMSFFFLSINSRKQFKQMLDGEISTTVSSSSTSYNTCATAGKHRAAPPLAHNLPPVTVLVRLGSLQDAAASTVTVTVTAPSGPLLLWARCDHSPIDHSPHFSGEGSRCAVPESEILCLLQCAAARPGRT